MVKHRGGKQKGRAHLSLSPRGSERIRIQTMMDPPDVEVLDQVCRRAKISRSVLTHAMLKMQISVIRACAAMDQPTKLGAMAAAKKAEGEFWELLDQAKLDVGDQRDWLEEMAVQR